MPESNSGSVTVSFSDLRTLAFNTSLMAKPFVVGVTDVLKEYRHLVQKGLAGAEDASQHALDAFYRQFRVASESARRFSIAAATQANEGIAEIMARQAGKFGAEAAGLLDKIDTPQQAMADLFAKADADRWVHFAKNVKYFGPGFDTYLLTEATLRGDWEKVGAIAAGILASTIAAAIVGTALAPVVGLVGAAIAAGVVAGLVAAGGSAIFSGIDWFVDHLVPDFVRDQFFGAVRALDRRDPLTLDLDGDGLETVPASAGVLFDHDGDGVATGTGWVGPDDGLLVLDRNGNGTIDSGRELFGDSTLKSNGQLALDGFDALAELDTNLDGKVDRWDAFWDSLRVWRDADQDGVSDAGELASLESLGITAFNTARTENAVVLADGNRIADLGTYEKTDGTTGTLGEVGEMADIDLAEDTFHRRFDDQVPLTEAALGLPNMQASGLVRDMREAASLPSEAGAGFAATLSAYSTLTTRTAQRAALDGLLHAWADTSTIRTLVDHARAAATPDDPGEAKRYRFSFGAESPVSLGAPIAAGERREVVIDGQTLTVHGLVDGDRWGYTQAALDWLRVFETLEAFNGRNFVDLAPTANHGGTGFGVHSTSTDCEVTGMAGPGGCARMRRAPSIVECQRGGLPVSPLS